MPPFGMADYYIFAADVFKHLAAYLACKSTFRLEIYILCTKTDIR